MRETFTSNNGNTHCDQGFLFFPAFFLSIKNCFIASKNKIKVKKRLFPIFQYYKQHSNEHLRSYILRTIPVLFCFFLKSIPGNAIARAKGLICSIRLLIHIPQSSKSISQLVNPPAVCENCRFFHILGLQIQMQHQGSFFNFLFLNNFSLTEKL